MRRFLAVASAVLFLLAGSSPSRGAVMVTPEPVQTVSGSGANLNVGLAADEGWLWERMLDRLTFPLRPDDWNDLPVGDERDQWIGAVAGHPGTAYRQ